MNWDEFEDWGRHIASWAADYHRNLHDQPVRPDTQPGEVAAQLPPTPPQNPEPMSQIFADFESIIMPGMTHWQHPRFFAYFPANAAPPSMLAEMLVSTIAAQCMLWQTSPAATELEQVMIDWLRQALGLPHPFSGVIQDSASSATLSAVLTMRETATEFTGNREGLAGKGALRIYCSDQVHSSIDRACWVAGIGQANLIKIETQGPNFGMNPDALAKAIAADRAAGHTPAGIVAITGGTSIGAWDDLAAIGKIAAREKLYLHLDAAWAGSAMICDEFRAAMWDGVAACDSIVFNPHKWLGAQFDCAVQFLKEPQLQRDTLKIEPSYLATHGLSSGTPDVTNFSEWTVPLGRRFRALKLWFLIRAYGLDGLQRRIRNHVVWAQELCTQIRALPGFVITTDPILSLFSFRGPGDDAAQLELVARVNRDGRTYLTQSQHKGRSVIRVQVGQFNTTRDDVMMVANVLGSLSKS